MEKKYTPSIKILQRYADVLVNFALNSGSGVKKGEVVMCMVPDVAKPLGLQLQNAILKAGAHPIVRLIPTGFDADYFKYSNENQLKFFPEEYYKSQVKLLDHTISIIADVDPYELKNTPPAKIMLSRNSRSNYRKWLFQKEGEGKFTWTLALWGVEAKAKTVGLSLEDYWQQIIQACFLDKSDPISHWKKVTKLQKAIIKKLDAMKIDSIHMLGSDVDLKLKIGADRKWLSGGGRNIPSFEAFTSPDWRGTEGWIRFNEPLYRYGQVINEIYLEFNKGLITKATAKKGAKLLQEMLKTENANKVGEFSLTDKRISRITHPMAETLFDENIGGPNGNSHIAIGMAYKDCYVGDQSKVTAKQWEKMGFNDSAEHTDIITTTDRTVTATTAAGKKVKIFYNGQFQI